MAEDLTARARIRDAALRQFAELGYERTTIRGIAAAAGVSLGLVRHHFGAKEALREAVDTYVLEEFRRLNAENRKNSEQGTFSRASTADPFLQRYLGRALLDGSAIVATMFDQMVEMIAEWLDTADRNDPNPSRSDRHTRAGVLTAMVLGVPLLREHVDRVVGVDTYSPDGERLLALALLDLYSHTLITPALADAARATLYDTTDKGDAP